MGGWKRGEGKAGGGGVTSRGGMRGRDGGGEGWAGWWRSESGRVMGGHWAGGVVSRGERGGVVES